MEASTYLVPARVRRGAGPRELASHWKGAIKHRPRPFASRPSLGAGAHHASCSTPVGGLALDPGKSHLLAVTAEDLPLLELRCLGVPGARLACSEPPPDVLWRKHFALLTYLALSPNRTRARSHLMGLLWAESPDEKARRSLNEAVRTLRAAVGDGRLVTRGEALELSAEALEVDALTFESLCAQGHLRALDLIRGEFLEGFHVDDAPAFDAWIENQRARIRDAATQLVVARAEEQLAVNRCLEARALARRALTLNPYSEPAVALGMQSAALEGDAASALALYHEFAARLEGDLEEQPSTELSALAARIRDGKWQRRRPRHAGPEPPLVGRRDTHAHLFAQLGHLPREGAVCWVIAGDVGSGRTRLLEACAERLALAGTTVAMARILESDHDAAWSTLRALMRGGLLEAPGIPATDHVGLRVLASIVPELAGRVAPIEPPDVAQVSDAVASLLRAVADERPAALLIDDAQWADGSTLAALRAVWSRERNAPVALALTVDTATDLSAELQALIASAGREIPGTHIRLEPFSAEEVAALAEAMAPWCAVKEERDRLARRVAHESGGNPFLAVTLLRDLGQAASEGKGFSEWPHPGSTYDSTLPITIPGVVRNAIVARAARLDAESMAVLRSASVAGELLDPSLIAEVSGIPGPQIDAALDRLEREHFVVFDGARYAFNGRLLPSVIERECMQPGGRRRLRERYIAALAARHEIDLQLLRARLLAAEHRPEAFEAALRVADQALAAGATRTAATAVRTAERAAGTRAATSAELEAIRQRLAVSPSVSQQEAVGPQ